MDKDIDKDIDKGSEDDSTGTGLRSAWSSDKVDIIVSIERLLSISTS
jgi:hypothetical protein